MAISKSEVRRQDKRAVEEPRRDVETVTAAARAASETDASISKLLARLRRKPSYMPFWAAFGLILPWIAGWFFVFPTALAAPGSGLPEAMRAIALLVFPIGIALVIAYFLYKSLQMHQVSEVLVHSALRLVRPQDVASESITSIAQAVRSEVDLLVNGIELAVQRATVLEEVVHKEIAAIERAFGSNEDRIRNLVAGIENQRTALHQASLMINNDANPLLTRLESNTQNLDIVIGNANGTIGRLEHSLRDSTVELARAIDQMAGRATTAGQLVGEQTAQMDRVSTVMVEELREFSRHFTNHIDQLSQSTSTLHAETADFGRSVQGIESTIIQTIRQSIDRMGTTNQEVARTIEHAISNSTEQMKHVADNLFEMIESTGSNTAYRLNTTTTELVDKIERAGIETGRQIEQSRGLVAQGLQSVAADYLDKVAKTSKELISGLDQIGGNLVAQLDSAGTGLAGRVEQSTAALFSEIGVRTEHIVTKLDDSAGLLFGRLEEQSTIVNTRVEDTAARVIGALEERTTNVAHSLVESAGRALSEIEAQNNLSATRIAETSTQVQTAISNAAGTIVGQLDDVMALATARLDDASTRFTQLVDDATGPSLARVEQIAQSVTSQIQSVQDLLSGTSGAVTDHIRETAEMVNRQMQESGIALATNIENSGGAMTEKIMTISDSFVTNVTKAQDSLQDLLNRATVEVATRLEDSTLELYARLEDTTRQLNTRLEGTTQQLFTRLDATSGNMTTQIEQTVHGFYTRLDQASSNMTVDLEASAARMSEQIQRTTGDIATKVSTVTEQLGGQLEKTTTELNTLFNANTKMMVEQLDTTATDVTNTFAVTAVRVTKQVSDANTELAQHLERTASEVTSKIETAGSSMFANIDQTARDLGARFDEATSLLESVTGEISGKLAATGANFDQVIDTAATRISSDLNRASEAFSQNLDHTAGEISQRFDTANSLLQSVSTDISGKLASTGGSFAEVMEAVSSQITSDLGRANQNLAERVEDVARLVESSVDKFSQEMERVVANRREEIDNLLGDTARRTAEIDTVMSGYIGLIEESLAAAEARSKELSRIITEQSNYAASLLNREIKNLEATSGGQITEASKALREQHERAMASMNEMLRATSGDFQQTAQEMRETALQVVKDIDSARAELSRAITELPEETRANADAMRRVVSDQITALNALADVVKRQTGTLDTSGPGMSTPRSFREPPRPGKAEGAAVPAPRIAAVSAPAAAAERSKVLADLAQTRAKIEELTSVAKPRAPAAVPRSLPREIDGFVDKINAAARDLVEVIEGGLPGDVERTFTGGDRGVYTRRLNASRNNNLKKLVAEKYGTDRRLRGRIDSYIRLFENLLELMSSAPKGDSMVEASVASESGQIYMMLAETIGRIKS